MEYFQNDEMFTKILTKYYSNVTPKFIKKIKKSRAKAGIAKKPEKICTLPEGVDA